MSKYLKKIEKYKLRVMLECPSCGHMGKVPKVYLEDTYFLCSMCGVFCSNFQVSEADMDIFEKLSKEIPNNREFNFLYNEYMKENNVKLRIRRW